MTQLSGSKPVHQNVRPRFHVETVDVTLAENWRHTPTCLLRGAEELGVIPRVASVEKTGTTMTNVVPRHPVSAYGPVRDGILTERIGDSGVFTVRQS
jgi:hypothetical protein